MVNMQQWVIFSFMTFWVLFIVYYYVNSKLMDTAAEYENENIIGEIKKIIQEKHGILLNMIK